jgi:hypothetical protein
LSFPGPLFSTLLSFSSFITTSFQAFRRLSKYHGLDLNTVEKKFLQSRLEKISMDFIERTLFAMIL